MPRAGLFDTEGVGQAKKYAGKLQARFAYSTNGAGIYQIDMETGTEQYVSQYPSPEELWHRTFAKENAWRDRFAAIAALSSLENFSRIASASHLAFAVSGCR